MTAIAAMLCDRDRRLLQDLIAEHRRQRELAELAGIMRQLGSLARRPSRCRCAAPASPRHPRPTQRTWENRQRNREMIP
jgi:hypothetical protein